MVITVVCDVFGEENNGTVIATNNLIRHLKQAGHEVRILCSNQNYVGQKGFYIVPNMNFGKLINNYVKKVGVQLAKPNNDIIRAALMGADHVHIMIPLALGLASIKIAKEMGISTTAGFHMQAENLTSYIKLNKFKFVNNFVYKYIYKHLYRYVDGVHYPTKFIRDVFESKIKKQTPGYVISNGVHSYVKKHKTQKPDDLKDKIVILSTGRYSREKSQDTLIKAVKYSKYKNKIQLILAGAGTKEKYYKKLAKKLPNYPIFKFYSRTEIIDVLNYCDIYVHPAQFELEGIACIEAITCGKLTLVSNSKLSATKNFAVDDKCVFKCRNAKSLAATIDYWLDHPEEKQLTEQKYLKSSVGFNQEECMKQMEEMIISVHNKFEQNKQDNNFKKNKKIVYYKDELNDDFANTNITHKKLDKNFKFVHKNPIWLFTSFVTYYFLAIPILWVYSRLIRQVKIKNKRAIKKLKGQSAFFYGNHTAYLLDACIPNFIGLPKRNKIVVSPDAVTLKGLKNLTQMLGALPVPEELPTLKNFYKAMEHYHKNFHITIYPEAHIWPYYTSVRAFSEKSFAYPINFNSPVIAFCVCYSKPKGMFKRLRKTNITVYLSDPIYPNLALNKRDAKKELRDKVYNFMLETSKKYSTYSPIDYLPFDETNIA